MVICRFFHLLVSGYFSVNDTLLSSCYVVPTVAYSHRFWCLTCRYSTFVNGMAFGPGALPVTLRRIFIWGGPRPCVLPVTLWRLCDWCGLRPCVSHICFSPRALAVESCRVLLLTYGPCIMPLGTWLCAILSIPCRDHALALWQSRHLVQLFGLSGFLPIHWCIPAKASGNTQGESCLFLSSVVY